jgi:hypothetical protein
MIFKNLKINKKLFLNRIFYFQYISNLYNGTKYSITNLVLHIHFLLFII